jgi:4-amino-4-deoxy-L-arabinose transferase-like glycosyltransferase
VETVRLSTAARQTAIIVLVSAAARLLLAAVLGLGVDESYEVVMARVPSLSYFDHPPLSFWIATTTSRLAQTEHRVILRLPFIVLFAVSTVLMYRLTARLYGERAGFLAALSLNLSPVFSLSTGGWILPDGPLVCAMLVTVVCASHVLVDPPDTRSEVTPRDTGVSWRWWIAVGVATGTALLSKYHGVFLIAGILLFMSTTREARRWLRAPQPYVAASIAILLTLPVILWNARHGFASLRFQIGRAATDGFRPSALALNLAGQLGYLLPWIGIPLLWQLWRGLRAGASDPPRWFLCCIAVGPIAVFTLMSLGGSPGLPHWPAPGYLFLFPLLGDALSRYEGRGIRERRRVWRGIVASVVAFAALSAAAGSAVATGWPARVTPTLFRHGDPSLQAIDWRELEPALRTRGLLGANTAVFTRHWIDGAKAGYALGRAHDVFCLCDDPRGFEFAFPPRQALGRDGLILVRTTGREQDSTLAGFFRPYFESIASAGRFGITRGGRRVLEVAVFRATSLRRVPRRIDP